MAVIGSTVSANLFGAKNPVGETVRIGAVSFEVIGTLQEKGVNFDGSSQDNSILIPVNTALRRVFNLSYIHLVYIRVKNGSLMARAEREIAGRLRERHRLDRRGRPDDFSIQNQVKVLAAARQTGNSFTALITGMALISLLVGGVGIMAVMLLTVRERTVEIGLRMAIGSPAARHPAAVPVRIPAAWGWPAAWAVCCWACWRRFCLGWSRPGKQRSRLCRRCSPWLFSLAVGLLSGIIPAQRGRRHRSHRGPEGKLRSCFNLNAKYRIIPT